VIEYAIFIRGLAQQWRAQQKGNLAQRQLMGEDDAHTLNTCIVQRKRAIPHSTMKNMTCVKDWGCPMGKNMSDST